MKAIFLSCNQALYDDVLQTMEKCGITGYTGWEEVTGCGMATGEPHLGSHAWPTMNSALLSMAENSDADKFLAEIKKIDDENPKLGLRAFWWEVGGTI